MFHVLAIAITSLLVLNACFTEKLDSRMARNTNVCRKLGGKVLIYAIFVDTKNTLPWTEYDLNSTVDSINRSIDWLHTQARANSIELEISFQMYASQEGLTVEKNLPTRSIIESMLGKEQYTSVGKLNKWGDQIAREVGENLPPLARPGLKPLENPRDKERLVARLRDEYHAESIVLLYMLNNYYKEELAISLNTISNEEVEYSIVGYKNPTIIAQAILRLFGASNLSGGPLSNRNKDELVFIRSQFPDAVMAFQSRDLSQLNICSFTKYLIGWQDQLDEKYHKLLDEGRYRPPKTD